MRFLSGREHGRTVGGVGVGWDVSEEVGRVRKYAIFIAHAAHDVASSHLARKEGVLRDLDLWGM
jgi:hypothetical protein